MRIDQDKCVPFPVINCRIKLQNPDLQYIKKGNEKKEKNKKRKERKIYTYESASISTTFLVSAAGFCSR